MPVMIADDIGKRLPGAAKVAGPVCKTRFLGDSGYPAKTLFRQNGRRLPGIFHFVGL